MDRPRAVTASITTACIRSRGGAGGSSAPERSATWLATAWTAIFWALKLAEIKNYSIECLAQYGGSEEMFTQGNVIKFEFPARGEQPPVKIFTYDNERPEAQDRQGIRKDGQDESMKGRCTWATRVTWSPTPTAADCGSCPRRGPKEFKLPGKTLPRAHGGPIEDLFWAIRNQGTPCSNFADYSGPFTEMILTGQLAMFAGPGKKVQWDVAGMKCTNIDELNQFVHRSYRKGWEV